MAQFVVQLGTFATVCLGCRCWGKKLQSILEETSGMYYD